MAKTISDPKFAKAKALIDSQVEPRIKEIVEQLNLVLSKHGIRAGCELTWLFDEVDQPTEGNDDDETKTESR